MWMMAAFQGLQNDSISNFNTKLLMIFVGVVALSMASQAIVVIIAAIEAKKAQKRLLAIAEELHARAIPIINNSERLIQDLVPKIKTISDNLVDATNSVKAKVEEFDATLSDVNVKTKAQVSRIDGMVTSALTATGALAAMVHDGIRGPVTEAVGVVNGFRAGINSFMTKTNGRGRSRTVTVYKADEPEV